MELDDNYLAEYGLYGPMKSASLELEGVLRRIHLSFDGTKNFEISVFDHKGETPEMSRAIRFSWNEYHGDMCKLILDTLYVLPGPWIESKFVLDCFCLFVTIKQSTQRNGPSDHQISCLMLQRVRGEGNSFTRIGTLMLKDLYGLRMRYQLREGIVDVYWQNSRGTLTLTSIRLCEQ